MIVQIIGQNEYYSRLKMIESLSKLTKESCRLCIVPTKKVGYIIENGEKIDLKQINFRYEK